MIEGINLLISIFIGLIIQDVGLSLLKVIYGINIWY